MRFINLFVVSFMITSVCLATTECQEIQLNHNGEKIYVGIKDYHDSIIIGNKGMVTIMDPLSNFQRELTGKTIEVQAMTLLERTSHSSMYAVRMKFPYDKEVARQYNLGLNKFYTICTVYH